MVQVMNGVLNVAAALIAGTAMVVTGYVATGQSGSYQMSEDELQAFRARAVADVKAELAWERDQGLACRSALTATKSSCSADLAAYTGVGGPEGRDMTEAVQTAHYAMVQQTECTELDIRLGVPECVNGGTAAKDDFQDMEKPAAAATTKAPQSGADKKDDGDYFTETMRLENDRPQTRPDKADDSRYFTENTRMEKPRYDKVDKKDDGAFFTDTTRLQDYTVNDYAAVPAPDPCRREDGSAYTGPGTYQNPFADENPCLVPYEEVLPETGVRNWEYAETTTYDDPCLEGSGTLGGGSYDASRYPNGDPCATDLHEGELPSWTHDTPMVAELPGNVMTDTGDYSTGDYSGNDYAYNSGETTTTVVTTTTTTARSTPANWTAPWMTYRRPFPGSTLLAPQPTIRPGGSDYRSQACS